MRRVPALATAFVALGTQAAAAAPASIEEAFETGYQLVSSTPASDGGGSTVFFLRREADVIACGVTLNFSGGDFVTRQEVLKSTCKDVK